MEKRIRVAIADDHPMVIDGLVNYLSTYQMIEVVATIGKVGEVPKMLKSSNPDILLMDYHFSSEKTTGLEMCKLVKSEFPEIYVIIISSFSDFSLIKRFVEEGASGYLLKTSTKEDFIEAIQNVFIGGEWFSKDIRELMLKERLQRISIPNIRFTRSEKDILKLIVEGHSTEAIAQKLFREKSTIDSHRKAILSKLQLMYKDGGSSSKNILFYMTKLNLSSKIDQL